MGEQFHDPQVYAIKMGNTPELAFDNQMNTLDPSVGILTPENMGVYVLQGHGFYKDWGHNDVSARTAQLVKYVPEMDEVTQPGIAAIEEVVCRSEGAVSFGPTNVALIDAQYGRVVMGGINRDPLIRVNPSGSPVRRKLRAFDSTGGAAVCCKFVGPYVAVRTKLSIVAKPWLRCYMNGISRTDAAGVTTLVRVATPGLSIPEMFPGFASGIVGPINIRAPTNTAQYRNILKALSAVLPTGGSSTIADESVQKTQSTEQEIVGTTPGD